jgi:hypothetical protein
MNKQTPPRSVLPKTRQGWRAWAHADRELGRSQLLQHGAIPSAMFRLHTRKGQLLAYTVQFVAPQQKALAYRFLRLACIAHEAVAVSFLAEAWMVDGDSAVAPSESERRREILSVLLSYRDHANILGYSCMDELLRDAEGKICGFDTLTDEPTNTSQGELANLLEAVMPTPDRAEFALATLNAMGPLIARDLGIQTVW